MSAIEERTYANCSLDDAETPFEAFRDVESVLKRIAELLNKPAADLAIWDPFYCAGTMVNHLRRLGFENVHNENKDAYQIIADGQEPVFDVLCSNPPFSGDNMHRIFDYCTAGSKHRSAPRFWLLLMPQYVSKKHYFLEHARLTAADHQTLFVAPKLQPYAFTTPATEQTPTVLHAAGSFQTVWFVSPFEGTTSATMLWWTMTQAENPHALMSATVAILPKLAPAANRTPAQRRWAKKQRRLAAKTGEETESQEPPTIERVSKETPDQQQLARVKRQRRS